MRMFLSFGKYSTLGLWIAPLLALFGFFGGGWNHTVLWLAVAIFFAHLGELAVIQGKLKMHDRDTIHDGLMVVLVGVFHWWPIINKTDEAR